MRIHPKINAICIMGILSAAVMLVLALYLGRLDIQSEATVMGYESRLFDHTKVHKLEIQMDDWDVFLSTCENEEYVPCSVIIDGERWENVGLRAKGNTSLLTVRSMGSQRFSFKIEFDHYENGETYYGLDKLCLNNSIQDNTYMKDYLVCRMMSEFDATTPLCSYVEVTANQEYFGLYLAIEGVEDSFLRRNYGADGGILYKPDSMGGVGAPPPPPTADSLSGGIPPEFLQEGGGPPPLAGDSDDVRLIYTDDNLDSYANIFNSAKVPASMSDYKRLIKSLKNLSELNQNNEIVADKVVDVDKTIRYFVVHNYMVNGDSYTGGMVHNYYLREKDGILSMIPWDYNLACGGYQSSSATETVHDAIDTPLSVTADGSRPMVDWIYRNPDYLRQYHAYMRDFLDKVNIRSIIDETEALIDEAVRSQSKPFCSYDEFKKGVNALRRFCELRTQSIRGQLDGTIPSTDEGQRANPSALFDASDLIISDMGSMGVPARPLDSIPVESGSVHLLPDDSPL